MKKIILICVISVWWVLCANAQQDAQFSQYIFNGATINPAYAGYKEQVYIQSSYRIQWQGLQGAPKNFSFSADGVVNNNNIGLALLVSRDDIGAQSNLSAYANMAYRLRMGNSESSRLAFALGFGVMQLGINGDKLNALDAGDTYIPVGKQTAVLPDARAGVYYSDETFFAGFSVNNMLAAQLDDNKDPAVLTPTPKPHYYLTGGAIFTMSDLIKLKPVFLLKDDGAGPTSLDLNSFILLNERIWLGAAYRTSINFYDKGNLHDNLQKANSIGILAEVYATEKLRIGYSFDYSLNKLRSYNSGSHEFSIGFYLGSSSNKIPSSLRCYF